jgi:hypothetical protein
MISSLSPQRLLAVVGFGLGYLGRSLSALALSGGVVAMPLALAVWDHERLRSRSGPFAWIMIGGPARADQAEPNDIQIRAGGNSS